MYRIHPATADIQVPVRLKAVHQPVSQGRVSGRALPPDSFNLGPPNDGTQTKNPGLLPDAGGDQSNGNEPDD